MHLPRSKFILFTFTFFVLILLFLSKARAEIDCLNTNPGSVSADNAEYCSKQLQDLMNQYLPAQNTNKKNLSSLQSQLSNINQRITALSKQLEILTNNIKKRESDLAFTQRIFNEKTADQYRFLRTYDPIMPFLESSSASSAIENLILREKVANEDRVSINQYAADIETLGGDRKSLEKDKLNLDLAQKTIASKTTFLEGEVAKVNAYLASISAKQQSFIQAKLDSLGISRSAYNLKGGCSSDINPFKSPGFAPAFGFFSFGVPNRVGLNQFGAKARAEAGQNAETILKAYYNADYTTGYNDGITIHVTGSNEFGQSFDDNWNIEDYLKHLYEMPTDWSMEALKAQVIAARSYALSYTNNGSGNICPSQSCQVVKKELNSGNWQAAVDATRGIVMTNGGQPIKAWFSSTHGGYAFTSSDIGWNATSWTKRLVDTTGGVSNFGDLMNNAYDKNSPMFYCDWGSRSENNHTAWLKGDELADIVNSVILAEKDASTKSHLYQEDKSNPENTDTWDRGRVRSELSSRGVTPFSSISDISINADFGSGKTTSITASGDGGNQTINGDDFKNYFNLRAPANIQIVGPLYNIEKR
jgi:SpoIID/LytB domain protein